MLEIIALIMSCRRMGAMLRDKGWENPIWMQILVVIFWFGGMFAGGICWAVFVGITKGEAAIDKIGFEIYPCMYLTAILSVGMLFLIAKMMPTRLAPGLPENPLMPNGTTP